MLQDIVQKNSTSLPCRSGGSIPRSARNGAPMRSAMSSGVTKRRFRALSIIDSSDDTHRPLTAAARRAREATSIATNTVRRRARFADQASGRRGRTSTRQGVAGSDRAHGAPQIAVVRQLDLHVKRPAPGDRPPVRQVERGAHEIHPLPAPHSTDGHRHVVERKRIFSAREEPPRDGGSAPQVFPAFDASHDVCSVSTSASAAARARSDTLAAPSGGGGSAGDTNFSRLTICRPSGWRTGSVRSIAHCMNHHRRE